MLIDGDKSRKTFKRPLWRGGLCCGLGGSVAPFRSLRTKRRGAVFNTENPGAKFRSCIFISRDFQPYSRRAIFNAQSPQPKSSEAIFNPRSSPSNFRGVIFNPRSVLRVFIHDCVMSRRYDRYVLFLFCVRNRLFFLFSIIHVWIGNAMGCFFNVMCKQEDVSKIFDSVMCPVSLFHDLLSFRVYRKNICGVFQANVLAHRYEMSCIYYDVCGYIRLKNCIIDNCMQKIGYKIRSI